MDNLNFYHNQNPYIGPYRNIAPQKNNMPIQTNSYAPVAYTSPVYTEVPYGITKRDYIKLGIEKTPSGEELHVYQLQNGQKVGIIKGEGCPIVQTCANVGSFDEPSGKEGISHLIEHSSYHGTKKFDDPETLIKDIGGYSNASTTTIQTQYYITLSNSDFENIEKAIDISADMFFNPNFSKLTKEKAIVSSEVQLSEGDEDNIVLNKIKKDLFSLNSKNPQDLITGSVDSVNSIDINDMFQYHNKYYTPKNSSVFVKSPIDPDELIKTVASKFNEASKDKTNNSIQRTPLAVSNKTARFDYISKDKTTKTIYIGFATPASTNALEDIKIKSLIKLISSRADFQTDKSDVYHDASRVVFLKESEDLNENNAFQELKEELSRVFLDPPDEFEMEKIKNFLYEELENSYLNNEETASSVVSALVDNKSLSLEKQIIKNLTKDDIIDAVKYFNFNSCAMGVIHPCTTTKEQIQQEFEQSRNYTTPVIVPKTTKQINVLNSTNALNIEPYSSKNIYTTTLEDNTKLVAVNSKTDKCNIIWELYNPDTNAHNIAAKYVLTELIKPFSTAQKYNIAKSNAHVGASSTKDGLLLVADCQYENIEDIINSLKKSFDADFNEKYFKIAKEYALESINLEEKETAQDIRNKERYGQSYNKNTQEIKEALEKLTIDDVKKYYNDIILNSYSKAIVFAPFDENPDSINKVASAVNIPNFSFKKDDLGKFKNVYTQKQDSSCYIKEQKTGQSNYQKKYNYQVSSNTCDNVKFQLLNNILDRRLYDRLREKEGLAYSVGSYNTNVGNDGSITLNISSSCNSKEDIQKIFTGFDEIIKELMTTPVSQKELQEAKDSFKREEYSLFDDDSVAGILISKMLNNPSGLQELQDNFKILDTITPQDIKTTANYTFKDPADYFVNADKDIIDQNKDFFSSLGKIKE